MVDLNSLFSGNDNLFKFLFVGGLVMVFFAISYPLQKKQDIELETNTFNQQASLLNKEIGDLNTTIKLKSKESSLTILEIKSLQKYRTKVSAPIRISINRKIELLKQANINSTDSLNTTLQEIKVKKIVLDYNQKRIELLETHSNEFSKYSFWLTTFGCIFSLSGLIPWCISCVITEKLKIKELKLKTKELNKP